MPICFDTILIQTSAFHLMAIFRLIRLLRSTIIIVLVLLIYDIISNAVSGREKRLGREHALDGSSILGPRASRLTLRCLRPCNLVPRACDPWEGNEGSGIIRFREESDWPLKWMRSSILVRIPGFRQRIIPEPSFPSQGSQARGTRLEALAKTKTRSDLIGRMKTMECGNWTRTCTNKYGWL
jgi:hypothetical protein